MEVSPSRVVGRLVVEDVDVVPCPRFRVANVNGEVLDALSQS